MRKKEGITVGHCGKLVIAADSTELPALEELRRRGEANGVPGLEMLGPAGLRDIEQHAVGSGALWSPSTSITDYRSVAAAMAEDIREAQGEIRLGVEVTGISRRGQHLALTAGEDPVVISARNRLRRPVRRPPGEDDRLGSGGADRPVPRGLLHAHRFGRSNDPRTHLPSP